MGFDIETRIRNVTAVLGPTNTGKTHLAIERMLGHESGMIGLPLRLLAREVYDKIAARIGPDRVALVTGEEKIRPDSARFYVCTVEAMPREIEVDFLAIDEIQLAADPERGHVFTDRLLHARGKLETLLLGAATMRDAIYDLVPGANFITRPRLSKLTYSGQKKITRLPSRTAIVAFSAGEVYSIAELIRRQQGGAAVVMGALSPRTRNAQVALYQSGDVDYLVATDAIGMGLNLDVNHVAFAATRKFDGHGHRLLTPAELAQIAGRAGRHMNDGTFGVTGDVEPFEQDVVERIETHTFDTVKVLQWRARALDFSSVYALRESLKAMPGEQRLVRARMADDVEALENVSMDRDVTALIGGPAAVAILWDVCQIPDYRKISAQNHAELVGTVFKYLMGPEERIPEDWFAKQVELADRTDGDIDTLANRISHIRTWTFVSNRPAWLKDPAHWQGRTREIEDSLSDALHELLAQRFIDRRTSALMKGLRAKEDLNADIGEDGAINVEGHYVGRLKGFRFIPDGQAEGIHGKAARNAAAHVLAKELSMRVRRVAAAKNDAFKLSRSGRILWRDQEIARLEPGEKGLEPQVVILADEYLQAPDKEKLQERLNIWIAEVIADRLKPLVDIAKAEDISGLAKGIAFRLTESFGALKRETVAEEIKSLDQNARAQLRKYGVRFGAFNIYFPALLKPAAAELTLALWGLKHGAEHGLDREAMPEPPRPGLTSAATDAAIPEAFYRACGYHLCGPRAVRIDILERLADLIRPMLAWRAPADNPSATPPRGATGDGAFTVTNEMNSILGCSTSELGEILKLLGFRLERRPKRKPAAATVPAAPAQPTAAAVEDGAEAGAGAQAQEEVASETAIEPAAAAPALAGAPSTEAASGSVPAAAAEPAETAVAAGAVPESPSGEPAAAPEAAGAEQSAAAPFASPESTIEEVAAGSGISPAAAQQEAPGEPEMEEVWRPRRRREHGPGDEQRQGRRRRRGHDRGQGQRHGSPGQGQRQGGQGQGGQGQGGQGEGHAHRDRDRHRHGRPGEGQAAAGASEAAASGDSARAGAEPRPAQGQQRAHEKHGGNKPGGPRHHGRRDRHEDGRQEGRHGKGQHRRDDRQGGGARVHQAAPPGKGGGKGKVADPDSPFAKLSALKQELEKRAQEQSSS